MLLEELVRFADVRLLEDASIWSLEQRLLEFMADPVTGLVAEESCDRRRQENNPQRRERIVEPREQPGREQQRVTREEWKQQPGFDEHDREQHRENEVAERPVTGEPEVGVEDLAAGNGKVSHVGTAEREH